MSLDSSQVISALGDQRATSYKYLRDYKLDYPDGGEPSKEEIKNTREYASFVDPNTVWQREEEVSKDIALKACLKMFLDMRDNNKKISWKLEAKNYIENAKREINDIDVLRESEGSLFQESDKNIQDGQFFKYIPGAGFIFLKNIYQIPDRSIFFINGIDNTSQDLKDNMRKIGDVTNKTIFAIYNIELRTDYDLLKGRDGVQKPYNTISSGIERVSEISKSEAKYTVQFLIERRKLGVAICHSNGNAIFLAGLIDSNNEAARHKKITYYGIAPAIHESYVENARSKLNDNSILYINKDDGAIFMDNIFVDNKSYVLKTVDKFKSLFDETKVKLKTIGGDETNHNLVLFYRWALDDIKKELKGR